MHMVKTTGPAKTAESMYILFDLVMVRKSNAADEFFLAIYPGPRIGSIPFCPPRNDVVISWENFANNTLKSFDLFQTFFRYMFHPSSDDSGWMDSEKGHGFRFKGFAIDNLVEYFCSYFTTLLLLKYVIK